MLNDHIWSNNYTPHKNWLIHSCNGRVSNTDLQPPVTGMIRQATQKCKAFIA